MNATISGRTDGTQQQVDRAHHRVGGSLVRLLGGATTLAEYMVVSSRPG
jgi:hypothetical protein